MGLDAMRRMAALLPPIVPVAEAVAARLRLSRAQRDRLTTVARRDTEDAGHPRGLAYSVGIRMRARSPAPGRGRYVALEGLGGPVFPLKAAKSSRAGLQGSRVARLLRAIERRWIDEHFPSRARVVEMLDESLHDG